jgi:hypothetical protein
MDPFESSRTFRLWDWSIGHCRLLIRSARNEARPDDVNVDLTFSGVFYLEIADTLRGIRVVPPTAEEREQLDRKANRGNHGQFYLIESAGRRYVVGAVDLDVSENTLPFMQSSLLRP